MWNGGSRGPSGTTCPVTSKWIGDQLGISAEHKLLDRI
jgi:hypothetical protein